MPDISIGGTKLFNVDTVTINVSLSGGEATRLPSVTATFTIPTDDDTILVDWLLAPQGDKRWKKVEITTYDRSKKVNKTWTLHKAFISGLSEGEYAGSGPGMTTATIEAVLIHAKENYDGKNILEVKAGEAEANPT